MKLIRTIVAAFALLSIGMPLSAQAQSFNIGPVNINLGGGGGGVGNLPPTNLDSFVYQSGMNQAIYGDEGDIDIPPIDGFNKENRINAGITGQNAAGLTTGHGSLMPDAWGADEFLAPPGEWDMSGNGTGPGINTPGFNLLQQAAGALARSNLFNATNNVSNSNITSSANVNGTPVTTPTITYMASPPAWVSAFGQWATQVVPYTLTQGMVPVQDQSTGLLIGWVSPGQQISDLLSGQNGMLLPGESAAAQTLLQNLTPANNITIQLP